MYKANQNNKFYETKIVQKIHSKSLNFICLPFSAASCLVTYIQSMTSSSQLIKPNLTPQRDRHTDWM